MKKSTKVHEETPETAAYVLAIDLDDLTLERIRSAVRGTDLAVSQVTPQVALEHARNSELPIIFLVEWTADAEDEVVQLSKALRSASRPGRCYILAIGGVSEQAALMRALSGSADGVLRRPFGNEWPLVYLRHALQAMNAGRGHGAAPREALREALESQGGGEVVVRCEEIVAHIHVQGGHIVWANLSSVPATMQEVAQYAGVRLEPEMSAAVKDECRATGAHFMEVLVKWGVIPEDRAREAVRAFVAGRVKLILDLPDAVALFLPKARAHSERLRFRASEIPSLQAPDAGADDALLDAAPPSSRSLPPLPLDQIAGIVRHAMRMEGALGAALLDRKTGAFLYYAGVRVDTEVAWSLVSALARLGPDGDEVMASAGAHFFAGRPLRSAPSLVLFMTFSAADITIGLARVMLARAAARGDDAGPDPG